MIKLPDIRINNIHIEDMDSIRIGFAEVKKYIENLRISVSDIEDYDLICNNLANAKDIEELCKENTKEILDMTGDINEVVSSLRSLQETARELRLSLDKDKKSFKTRKINKCLLEYDLILKEKINYLQEMLGSISSNLKEEVSLFWEDFKEGAFRGVKEDNIQLKHSFNLKNLNGYLSSLEFEILKLFHSEFSSNFIPINVFFRDGKMSVMFNSLEYSTSQYDEVKNLFDILSKEQAEKDLADSQINTKENNEVSDKLYNYSQIRKVLIDAISYSFNTSTETAESLLIKYSEEECKNFLKKNR